MYANNNNSSFTFRTSSGTEARIIQILKELTLRSGAGPSKYMFGDIGFWVPGLYEHIYDYS